MWILKTGEAADPTLVFRILPGSIKTVGRATGADFIVGATALEVLDLESTNGTFVNGERTARATLRNGDRLGVGRVDLIVTSVNS